MGIKTDKGLEVPAVTTDQMRGVDRIAIEEAGPNLYQIMENAGRNLAELALFKLGTNWEQARVVVLAGPGGKGGGGICAARHLENRGVDVCLCLSKPDQLSEVPTYQRKIFRSTGRGEVLIEELKEVRPQLILDALIGYSLNGAPRGFAKNLIQGGNNTGVPILSLDVPSGLEATGGETPGVVINPHGPSRWHSPRRVYASEKRGIFFWPTLAFRLWYTTKLASHMKTRLIIVL